MKNLILALSLMFSVAACKSTNPETSKNDFPASTRPVEAFVKPTANSGRAPASDLCLAPGVTQDQINNLTAEYEAQIARLMEERNQEIQKTTGQSADGKNAQVLDIHLKHKLASDAAFRQYMNSYTSMTQPCGNRSGCQEGGKSYKIGDMIPGGCNTCVCTSTGIMCTAMACAR